MMEILIALIALALFITGVVLVIRVLTLPGEVRAVTEKMASMERELRAVQSRLDAARARIDRLEGGAAPEAAPPPPKKAGPSVAAMITPPLPDEVQPEFVPAISRRVPEATAARRSAALPDTGVSVPPPLPVQAAAPIRAMREEPAESTIGAWLKSLGPKDPNMTWEMALGTYWLPRLGALAMSAAIVFLLTLAFQKWGAPVRVAMGYGVAGALLGIGWRLDRSYPKYARVLFGAGFALTYFVTFAAHFVEFAQVFETPYLSLAGQAAIVIIWAAMAQRRRSPVIAGIAVLTGHFAIALATHSIAAPGPYSVAGIVFLSAGGAFFLARNGWYAVAGLGLLASYANHFYLMSQIDSQGTVSEFVVGIAVLSVYFLVYALAELFSPEELRRGRVPFWFRNGFVTVNSLCVLLLGAIQMQGYDFAREQPEIFYYALAAALLAICLAYLRVRSGDPLYNAYFVKGISATTLGLAFQFDSHTLTASLAIESLVLLYASRRSGLLVSRVVAVAAGALAVAQGVSTIFWSDAIAYAAEGYAARAGEAGTVVLAMLGAALLYQRTDWGPRSPSTSRFSPETRLLLWQLDLLAAPPSRYEDAKKPAGGVLIPSIFSVCAAGLAAGFAAMLVAPEDYALAAAIGALALTLAATAVRATPYALASFVLTGVAAFTASFQFRGLSFPDIFGGYRETQSVPLDRAAPILACFALIALASEKRYLGHFTGLSLHQMRKVSYALYGVFALLLGLLLDHTIGSSAWTAAALLIAAASLALAAIPLQRQALAWCGVALLAWAAARWNNDWTAEATRGFLASAWAAIALAAAGERYYKQLGVKYAGPAVLLIAASVFVPYVYHEAPREWVALGWTLGAAALVAHGGILRVRTSGAIGAGLLLIASIYESIYTQTHDASTRAIILGFAAPALCWIASERAARKFAPGMGLAAPLGPISGAMAAIATALLVLMLYRLPQLAEFYLTISWSVLAVALFGLAIAFREKLYRYCGLAVLGLAFLRVALIDTRQLEAVPRIFALGGIGFVALALGFGYSRVFARSESAIPKDDDAR